MRFYLLIASTVAAMAAAADTKLHLVLPAELEASKADSETPMLQHYGKPPECDADEQAFSIQGIPGAVCSPKCTDFMPCPKDVPAGVTAMPQCALENRATGDKYCVLICQADEHGSLRAGDGPCGDATCQPVQGSIGVCTYV